MSQDHSIESAACNHGSEVRAVKAKEGVKVIR